jgi:hypothetical protein
MDSASEKKSVENQPALNTNCHKLDN